MASNEKRLILASASPRRRELLERFGLPFTVLPARGDEAPPDGRPTGEYVRSLAEAKGAEVYGRCGDKDAVIIAADTVVELRGELLGKPAAAEEAADMLRRLSGETHRVWTGVCVRQGERVRSDAACTQVRFRALSEEEIAAYVATGEPLDKAGAYGYQGLAGVFVESIHGDYFNVVGLPLYLLERLLEDFGVSLLRASVRPGK